MTNASSTVVSVVPRAAPTLTMQNVGKLADMYRIAAWVTDNGGRAKIKDGYEDQGPDQLLVSSRVNDDPNDTVWETVFNGFWVVMGAYGHFKILSESEFEALYELRENLKTGDPRRG